MSFISGGTSFGRTSINRGVSLIESMAATGTVDSETSITGSDGLTYKTRRWEGNGTFTPTGNGQIQYLIVGGGGAGGGNNSGGGAGGGYRTNATGEENPNGQDLDALLDVTSGTEYTVVVGEGGTQDGNCSNQNQIGSDSSITGAGITDSGGTNSIVAKGGGNGGGSGASARSGGSGGGGAFAASAASALTSPTTQGYNGGTGTASPSNYSGGGGGGAGGSGGNSNGGAGRNNAILQGSDITYAGGGGGWQSYRYHTNQQGGSGGGGQGGNEGSPQRTSQYTQAPTAGTDELGGGGGASSCSGQGNASNCQGCTVGGDGIVIIRWQYE